MNWIESLEKLVGKEIVFTNPEILSNYASDYTEDITCLPQVVVTPNSTSDISKVLAFCNDHKIPVTPRGAGTGLSGGSIPVSGRNNRSLPWRRPWHIDQSPPRPSMRSRQRIEGAFGCCRLSTAMPERIDSHGEITTRPRPRFG